MPTCPAIRRLMRMALLMLALGAVPAARAASMWTGWSESNATLEQCQQMASGKMRELGFAPRTSGNSIFGWRGQDGISVRCIPERQMAAIFVYTTNDEEGRRILDQMHVAFPPPASHQQGRPSGGGKF
jgi:CubicO group peptidase (beta-lactamase class C family)